MTLQEILQKTSGEGALEAAFSCQATGLRQQATKGGKPYYDLEVSDGTASQTFKVWQDSPAYAECLELHVGDCLQLAGVFRRNSFGLNVEQLRLRFLKNDERAALFAGSPEASARQAEQWALIEKTAAEMKDPRLRLVCGAFLAQYGDRFRRAAAARDFHHARRGGLLEHTAQMMRSGLALETAYPEMNWDLIKAGILFHDCGKLWENDYVPEGFESPFSTVGELLGHIPIGIELVNKLWRELEEQKAFPEKGEPARELVRQHLLHLVGSHHGQKEFGAPVTPRTPEAWVLHYIDNLDAKVEMLKMAYAEKPQVAPGIFDHRRPLEGRPVAPLGKWKEN
jgi:3'-5' exoribonuclease